MRKISKRPTNTSQFSDDLLNEVIEFTRPRDVYLSDYSLKFSSWTDFWFEDKRIGFPNHNERKKSSRGIAGYFMDNTRHPDWKKGDLKGQLCVSIRRTNQYPGVWRILGVRTKFMNNTEALVYTTAHEFRHIWQHSIGFFETVTKSALKSKVWISHFAKHDFLSYAPERDACYYADKKLRLWRKTR